MPIHTLGSIASCWSAGRRNIRRLKCFSSSREYHFALISLLEGYGTCAMKLVGEMLTDLGDDAMMMLF